MNNINIEYLEDGLYISHEDDGDIIYHESWEEIEHKLLKHKLKDKILVHFNYSYGRHDYFVDSYIMDKDVWNELKAKILNTQIYLGEIAGRHSEVVYDVTEESIVEVTDINKIINFNIGNGIRSVSGDCLEYFEE